jgi:hypothetical protein
MEEEGRNLKGVENTLNSIETKPSTQGAKAGGR